MKPYASLGAVSALVQLSHANLDIVTLLTPSGNFIQEAAATLVVGDIPNPVTGDVALWSAIMMDKQDFLQGVTQNSPPGLYGNLLRLVTLTNIPRQRVLPGPWPELV